MSENNFTKGPWAADDCGVVDSENSIVCDTYATDSEGIANAHLIAAAPEMYEMLESLCEQDECQMFKYLIKKLLAKARGEL